VSSASAQPQRDPGRIPGPRSKTVEFSAATDCYPVANPDSSTAIGSVDDLVDEYNDGGLWPQLQTDIKALLATCAFAVPLTPDDFRTRTFIVTLVSNKQEAYNVVVPQRQPYSTTLPGVRSVNAIILVDAKSKSDKPPRNFMFMSMEVQDPLKAQIASTDDAPASIASRNGSAAAVSAYAARSIPLPFGQASIIEAGIVTVKDPVSGTSTEVPIAITYTNTPKVHLEFTAVAGAIVGPFFGAQKMKVDAGRYASDPLSHSLTMATVAWHLKPYDSSLSEMSAAERWAVLVGGVLTPAAGVGVGVSFGIIRRFSISAGMVGIWVPSAVPGSGVGSPVATDASQKQLENTFNRALFIGGAYVFRQGS